MLFSLSVNPLTCKQTALCLQWLDDRAKLGDALKFITNCKESYDVFFSSESV